MTDVFALMGISVVLCAGLLAWLTAWRICSPQALWCKLLTLLCFALLWIPLGTAQIPVVAYVRGFTADLSITLIALAMGSIGHRALGWRATPKHEQAAVMAAVAGAALFLYPLALGWGDLDAYGPGWGSWGMLLILLVLCLVSWAKGLLVLPALVSLALMAWSFGWMESGNLWDYLLDPWLSTFALGYVVKIVFIKCSHAAVGRFR